MNRTILIGLCILLIIPIVLAAAPTVPSTQTPANNSVFFDTPNLSCSGSTDGDADDIYYEFWLQEPFTLGEDETFQPFTSDASGSNTQWGGSRIKSGADGAFLYGVESMGGNYTRCRLTTDGGTVMGYAYSVDDEPTGYYWVYWNLPLYLEPDTFYRVECDEEGEDYRWEWDNTPGFIKTSPNGLVNITTGSVEGGNNANAYNWREILVHNATKLLQNTTDNTYNWTSLNWTGTYNWTCRASDINGETSAYTDNLTLYRANFSDCEDSDSVNQALNFTAKDEETLEVLTNVSFDAAWEVTTFGQTVSKNFGLTDYYNYAFCLDPPEFYANVTGFIDYDSNETDYSYPRQYYFDNAEIIGSNQQNIDLYQLLDTYASAVTFNVLRAGQGVSNAIIHLQRYNPGDGTSYLVAMTETSAQGSNVIYLRLTDAWYKVFVYEDNVLQYSTGAEHILASPYNIYLSGAAGDYSSYWEMWQHFENIAWNISWNNDSHLFGATFDDSTGAATTACLKVDKLSINQTENICYNCTTSSSATLYCGVTDLDASYVAKFIVDANPWRVLGQYFVDLQEGLKELIGPDGIFYSILIIGLLTFLGIWNPQAAIVLAVIGVVVTSMLGFLSIGIGFVMSLIVAAIILLVKLRT